MPLIVILSMTSIPTIPCHARTFSTYFDQFVHLHIWRDVPYHPVYLLRGFLHGDRQRYDAFLVLQHAWEGLRPVQATGGARCSALSPLSPFSHAHLVTANMATSVTMSMIEIVITTVRVIKITDKTDGHLINDESNESDGGRESPVTHPPLTPGNWALPAPSCPPRYRRDTSACVLTHPPSRVRLTIDVDRSPVLPCAHQATGCRDGGWEEK